MKYTKLVYHIKNEIISEDVTLFRWSDVMDHVNSRYPNTMWYADNEEWDFVYRTITQNIYFVGGN